ncbi:uncharacterized protein [Triticum aestivum]|uniref:uncharacterized protein isoform X2 n=1 Tax=Triticum aestivum TaxID=4565 RepID=UPI001D031A7A|nr:uncharacterized protein LOC123046260 isoform X2 [Triticum aestivum]
MSRHFNEILSVAFKSESWMEESTTSAIIMRPDKSLCQSNEFPTTESHPKNHVPVSSPAPATRPHLVFTKKLDQRHCTQKSKSKMIENLFYAKQLFHQMKNDMLASSRPNLKGLCIAIQ